MVSYDNAQIHTHSLILKCTNKFTHIILCLNIGPAFQKQTHTVSVITFNGKQQSSTSVIRRHLH